MGDKINFIIENWQFVGLLLGSSGGGGWVGYLLASKSRKIDLQTKTFQMQSEMIDGVKKDFEDRISYLQSHIETLNDMIKTSDEIISRQRIIISENEKIINKYKRKYGVLNEK